MARSSGAYRKEALLRLMPLLWKGKAEQACVRLLELPLDRIKDPDRIRELIGCLAEHAGEIPGCRLRKRRGLRNSSNKVEAASHRLAAHRRKGRGMGRPRLGSLALAEIKALIVITLRRLSSSVRTDTAAFAASFRVAGSTIGSPPKVHNFISLKHLIFAGLRVY
jgi:hypothetical protein